MIVWFLTTLRALALVGAAGAPCPPAGAPDAPACNARAGAAAAAQCGGAAQLAERCADRSAGSLHAAYLARAGSEFAKAGLASGARSAAGRRWLAHAIVLDERVQDDPSAPRGLRLRAKRNADAARSALAGTRKGR